jgi:uncharacterized delta-60 repeat protein
MTARGPIATPGLLPTLALALLALFAPAGAAASGTGSLANRLGLHSAIGAATVFNGRIVVAGFSSRGGLTLARYLDDGRLDPGFGRGGLTTPGYRYRPAAIQSRPGGGFVVLAAHRDPCVGEYVCQERLPLFGFTSQGRLDPAFGNDGVSWGLAGTRGGALAPQPDGRIVAAATDRVCHSECISGTAELARFLPDGRLDPGFGAGGVVHLPQAGGSFSAVATELEGGILAGGDLEPRFGAGGPILARYSRDGVLDPSFGVGGVAAPPRGFDAGAFQSLALTETTITAAGGGGGVDLARYSLDGQVDPSFGVGGHASVTLGAPGSQFVGEARLLGIANHRVYATAGPVGLSCRRPDRFRAFCRPGFSLARLLTDGSLDPTFGHDGIVRTPLGAGRREEDGFASPVAIAAGEHGRIILAGSAAL